MPLIQIIQSRHTLFRAPARTVARATSRALLMGVLFMVVALGCSEPDAPVATGGVDVFITDSPSKEFAAVLVTIDWVALANDDTSVTTHWKAREVDLKTLASFDELLSAATGIPVGAYDRVRLAITAVSLVTPGSDGDEEPEAIALDHPPGAIIDVLLADPVEVLEGERVSIAVDIDIDRSVRPHPRNEGELIFEPVATAHRLGSRRPGRLVRVSGRVVDTTADGRLQVCPWNRFERTAEHDRPAPWFMDESRRPRHLPISLDSPTPGESEDSRCVVVATDMDTAFFDVSGAPSDIDLIDSACFIAGGPSVFFPQSFPFWPPLGPSVSSDPRYVSILGPVLPRRYTPTPAMPIDCESAPIIEEPTLFDSRAITVVGWLDPLGSTGPQATLSLYAAVVEGTGMGAYSITRGEIATVPDEAGFFDLMLEDGDWLQVEGSIEARLRAETVLIAPDGSPTGTDALAVGSQVELEGVYVEGTDGEPVFLATLILLAAEPSDTAATTTGEIWEIDDPSRRFRMWNDQTFDQCVDVAADGEVVFVQRSPWESISRTSGFEGLEWGMTVQVDGSPPSEGADCIQATRILITDLAYATADPETTCRYNTQCRSDEYCAFSSVGYGLRTCGLSGRCVARPERCLREFEPVCGCDGSLHATACEAATAGVDIGSWIKCSDATGASGNATGASDAEVPPASSNHGPVLSSGS